MARTRLPIAALAFGFLGLFGTGCPGDRTVTLRGTGATFPAPLYKRWFLEYHRRHPDVRADYQAVGSGAGVRQLLAGLVDFAASDAAMTDDEIAQVPRGVVPIPMTAGGVAVAYNLPGVTEPLRLSRRSLAAVFLGRVGYWDDPLVAADNPGRPLPRLPVTVVRRSEASGTTFAFSSHLAAASPEWASQVGAGKSGDRWPAGVGARGNSGVAATVRQTPGAVGYVEAGYAGLTGLPVALLENKGGRYVRPTAAAGRAALEGAEPPADLRLFVPDPPGPAAYPVVTLTWLLCYRVYPDERTAEALRALARFGLTDGQQWSEELGYLPLPREVIDRALAAVEVIGAGGPGGHP